MNRNFDLVYNYVYKFCSKNKLECGRSYNPVRCEMDINVKGCGRSVRYPVSEYSITGVSYVRLVEIADNITDSIAEAFLDNKKKHDDRADAMRYSAMYKRQMQLMANSVYGRNPMVCSPVHYLNVRLPIIKNVIFNDPATIVFWSDGSKTVVKATDEAFDPEKGLAMAITKKIYGNQGNYYNQIKKWLPKEEPKEEIKAPTINLDAISGIGPKLEKALKDAFKGL